MRCRNGTLYTGYTNDLKKRLKLHNEGKGAKYLRGKAPIKLVWCKEYKYYKWAVRLEFAIKKLTKKDKELLVKKAKKSNSKL